MVAFLLLYFSFLEQLSDKVAKLSYTGASLVTQLILLVAHKTNKDSPVCAADFSQVALPLSPGLVQQPSVPRPWSPLGWKFSFVLLFPSVVRGSAETPN